MNAKLIQNLFTRTSCLLLTSIAIPLWAMEESPTEQTLSEFHGFDQLAESFKINVLKEAVKESDLKTLHSILLSNKFMNLIASNHLALDVKLKFLVAMFHLKDSLAGKPLPDSDKIINKVSEIYSSINMDEIKNPAYAEDMFDYAPHFGEFKALKVQKSNKEQGVEKTFGPSDFDFLAFDHIRIAAQLGSQRGILLYARFAIGKNNLEEASQFYDKLIDWDTPLFQSKLTGDIPGLNLSDIIPWAEFYVSKADNESLNKASNIVLKYADNKTKNLVNEEAIKLGLGDKWLNLKEVLGLTWTLGGNTQETKDSNNSPKQ